MTAGDPATVAAIDALMARQARQYRDAAQREAVLAAADRDAACVVAQAIAAIVLLHRGERDRAAGYLERGRAAQATASDREQRFLAAIAAWQRGEVDTMIAELETIAEHYPRDLYAVRLCCMHKFYTRKDPDGALALVRKVVPAAQDRAAMVGLLSFMEEEAKLFAEAEAHGREAVALDRTSILGQHTVAHVMEAEGRDREGVAWLRPFIDTWDDLNESFYPHMWMHLGLFHLGLGESEAVCEIIDRGCFARYADLAPAQLYGAVLMVRAELDGIDLGDRWRVLAARIEKDRYVHVDPLTDLHLLYALERGGRDAARFPPSLEAHAAQVHESMRGKWQGTVVPMARAIRAFLTGDAEQSWHWLHGEPVATRFFAVGGSDVERSVFTTIWLHTLLRSGRRAEAIEVLEAMRRQRGDQPRLVALLAVARQERNPSAELQQSIDEA